MLLRMVPWLARGCSFTVAVLLLFTVGCAGASEMYPEPSTAADYAQQNIGETTGVAAAQADGTSAPPGDGAANTRLAGYEDTDPSALTQFRSDLEPYGAWVDDPVYGTVWVPDAEVVGADFAPYVTAGHWGYTEEGDWIWVSDYPWGWATFHYGRWAWIGGRGWGWIPGRVYAPAWVVWRVGYDGYDYVGWAPTPPWYYWSGGVAVAFWVVPPAPYVFCHSAYLFAPHVHTYIVRGPHASAIAQHTRTYQPAGPSIGGSPGHGFARPVRGPSLGEAHVPASAVPRTFAKPEPRALAAARPASPAIGSRGAAHGFSGHSYGRVSGSAMTGSGVGRPSYFGQPASRGFGSAYGSGMHPRQYGSLGSSPYGGPTAVGHPSSGSMPWHGAATPPAYSGSHVAPSYGRGLSMPTYHGASSPSFHSSSGGVRSSPSFHSSPGSFHSGAAMPSSHPSRGAPSFHSAGRSSGGGGRRGR